MKRVQSLYSLGVIDINTQKRAFEWCVAEGRLKMAKWLYSLGGIDIHAQNEHAFVYTCHRKDFEFAKWLYSLGGIDIHAQNDKAFAVSLGIYGDPIAEWLCTICNTYRMDDEGRGFIYLTSINIPSCKNEKEPKLSSLLHENSFVSFTSFTRKSFFCRNFVDIAENLEKHIMNNDVTLDEDILKFGMFYGMKNVVIKCLDNKVMLPTGSLKYLYTKEISKTMKHEIWIGRDKIPRMYYNKENIVKILYNYGYTLNDEDKEILKKHGIDSKEFV